MRISVFTLLLSVAISSKVVLAEPHPVSQTEVVTLEELAQRTKRFSESNPEDADALKQLGQAWLESYVSGRRYFVLNTVPERLPPWTLRSAPLIPRYGDYKVGRRTGDGTAELVNALTALDEALKRAPSNQEIQVLVAYCCLIAVRQETVTGVPMSGRPEVARRDGAPSEVGPWEQRALVLCRAANAVGPERPYRQDDPWSYACSILHYLFEESGVKPDSKEEMDQAAGGKDDYEFFKDAFQLPVVATTKPSPADLAIINALYPEVPFEQNGALVYLDAVDALVSDSELSEELRMIDFFTALDPDAMPQNLEARLEALLNANIACLDLVRQASAHRSCRYPVDFESDWNFVSAFMSGGRELAELLEMRALQGVLAGRADPVLDSIRQIALLANSARNEPIDISQLVRGSMVAQTIRLTEILVGKMTLDNAQREEVQRILVSLDSLPGVRAAWQVERLSIDRPVIDEDINVPAIGLEHTDLTPMQRVKSLSRIRTERTARIELLSALLARTRWEAIYTEVIAPREVSEIEKTVFVSILSRSAQLRAAITALGVERYRSRHGDYPADLSALAPEFVASEFLVDPFSGTLLQWRTTENGFVVQSVGDPGDVKRRRERAELYADGQDPLRGLSFKVTR